MTCEMDKCPLVSEIKSLCIRIDDMLAVWGKAVPIKLVVIMMGILAAGFGLGQGVQALLGNIASAGQ